MKGAEGERAKERGLRPSRRRHRRVKAGQDGSRKEEEEEEGPSDRGFPAPVIAEARELCLEDDSMGKTKISVRHYIIPRKYLSLEGARLEGLSEVSDP